MNLILLGGNHKSNKEWIEDVEKAVRHMFESTKIQYYDHWEEKAGNIDLNLELKNLISNSKRVKNLVIFAKSAGTILTLQCIFEKTILPEKCIFVGTAINWGKACGYDLDRWIENFSVPTLFIQKREDPAISYNDLQNYLFSKGVKSFKMVRLAGSDHSYNDVKEFARHIRDFIS